MRVKVGDLRRLIHEELERDHVINEFFGGKADFGKMITEFLEQLWKLNERLNDVHKAAPPGPAKAIVAGMHSDLFNKIAEFRDHVKQLKGLTKKEA